MSGVCARFQMWKQVAWMIVERMATEDDESWIERPLYNACEVPMTGKEASFRMTMKVISTSASSAHDGDARVLRKVRRSRAAEAPDGEKEAK